MYMQGSCSGKKGFPSVHFYDQDFVDIYEKTWVWMSDNWLTGTKENGFQEKYLNYPDNETVNQFEACLSTFFWFTAIIFSQQRQI